MTKRKKPEVETSEQKKSTARTKATPPQESSHTEQSFSVVGIGASAGGLAAFEAFLSSMPSETDPGVAFVLVQHLAPDHKSILTDLIKRYTAMQVFEVEDGMPVQPNCTYIIPPKHDMAFLNGTLQLLDPASPRGCRLPIDFFFRSLAQDLGERAIGIVLSGTGTDGTLGVRAIKGEGGMVMVQTPDSTEYDGMPRSAIATGLTDFILPPSEMPAQLMAYVKHARGTHLAQPTRTGAASKEDILAKICILVRSKTGHDFSRYKRNTIMRRVERRLAVHQIEGLEAYVSFMQKTPEEVDALFADLLIGVTSFFRDAEPFLALQDQIVAPLLANRPAGTTIRIWVPACSTGEEAYSIAMLFQEAMEKSKQMVNVQIFATDIDERAINVARTGLYPDSITADVSPERLSRFFIKEPDGAFYRIHKSIRDMMIFSKQDVVKDPPFSKLDFLSCRNLLIYMGAELQHKLISIFHYALKTNGVLFLGTSETIGELPDCFTMLDRKAKLYRRQAYSAATRGLDMTGFMPMPTYEARALGLPPSAKGGARGDQPLRELTEEALLQQVAPSAVLVNDHGDILYLHGRTGQYLEPAPGKSTLNILRMAREGLRERLPAALHLAVTNKETVSRSGLRIRTNGDFTMANLTIRPVVPDPDIAPPTKRPLFLIMIEEAPMPEPDAPTTGALVTDDGGDTSIEALRRELRTKEEYLQSINEELQSSNEELRSSNEEMQSVNEELQSTNEELETSKEELQSVNEELATVNAELQAKVLDLSRASDDMNNLLSGTGIGTIFVDHKLCIRRFTPAAATVTNLIQTDVGRPIGHITSNLVGYDRLPQDVQAVLDSLEPKEIEVQSQSGEWYLLGIRPYRTLRNVIEGAVITFTDISELRAAKAEAQESATMRRLAIVVRDAHDAITVQALDGSILAWNPAAEQMYGWSETEALAMNIRDLFPKGGRQDALARLTALVRTEILEPYQTQRLTKDGQIKDVWMTATALTDALGKTYAVATTERAVGGGNEEGD
jgi:two-component system, chemotaxis family, CheB/CheR fusion protein